MPEPEKPALVLARLGPYARAGALLDILISQWSERPQPQITCGLQIIPPSHDEKTNPPVNYGPRRWKIVCHGSGPEGPHYTFEAQGDRVDIFTKSKWGISEYFGNDSNSPPKKVYVEAQLRNFPAGTRIRLSPLESL